MNAKTVDYYFAYLSPYAFLANTRIGTLLAARGVTIRHYPIAHEGSSDGPAFSSARYTHIIEEDVPRFAREYGLRFLSQPPLTESYTASAGFLYAEDEGAGAAYNDGVFRARWSDGKDISRPDVLVEIAVRAGLDRDRFLAAIENRDYRERLSDVKRQAATAGVFGVPFFIFEGKKFWGNDRIEWLLRALPGEVA